MLKQEKVLHGDCLDILASYSRGSFDMAYLDPPFFTGRNHQSSTRDGNKSFSFSDVWQGSEDYLRFVTARLIEVHRVLKSTGTVFFHGDHNNTHLARLALDEVFGEDNFVSEVIWYYKRWSNAKKGLLQQHQNILVYSKTKEFKWNKEFVEYSNTTNIDQIMQKRSRDTRGKAIYSKDKSGNTIFAEEKRGVPLGDVWEIPFLNPKAKERTGYPTQKPILLLERIISLVTDPGDTVLDPFCGSGTTLVAAEIMGRLYLGIDISADAVDLSKTRIEDPVRTESNLLKKGIESYETKDSWVDGHLAGIDFNRVQRNAGIDGLLKNQIGGRPAFIRVQRVDETLADAIAAIKKATSNKGNVACVVVRTTMDLFRPLDQSVIILQSAAVQLSDMLSEGMTRGAA